MVDQEELTFDFRAHEQEAVSEYLKKHAFFEDLATVVKRILEESLRRAAIPFSSVEARAKDPASFGKKAATPSDKDPTRPKYAEPMRQITDMAGVRVIAYFPNTVREIDGVLMREFRVMERSDKGAELIEDDRFGYLSVHYLVKLSEARSQLPEYESFADAIAEVQVRTILQHAWAEIEHDIQYKSTSVIPTEIRRRFMSLAGLLEIADREFQAIQNADKKLTQEAQTKVQGGQLREVEITPTSLKAFLDKRLGQDRRMSEFSYDWTARLLKRLGFRSLHQVDQCVRGYDDDALSRIASGSRYGQTARFEFMLLAGMGENFMRGHLYAGEPWFGPKQRDQLRRFREQGIEVREYDPWEAVMSDDSGSADNSSSDGSASVAPPSSA